MKQIVLIIGLLMAMATGAQAATINLAWDANTVDKDLSKVNIYRIAGACVTQGPLAFVGKIGATVGVQTTYADTVTADGTYCYESTWVDTAGNESAHSNRAEAIVNVNPPSAPLNLRVTAVQ